MSRHFLAGLAGLTLAACAASAHPALPEASNTQTTVQAQAVCTIQATPTHQGLLIEALLHTADSSAGDFHFVIEKSGPSGTSQIEQGGPFEAAAGSTSTLGSAEINVSRGDSYSATFQVRGERDQICSEERRG